MSFLSGLFGNKNAVAVPAAAPPVAKSVSALSPVEEVLHEIEKIEGELNQVQANLAAATDSQIKTSLAALLQRKTQAIVDLKDKLETLRRSTN